MYSRKSSASDYLVYSSEPLPINWNWTAPYNEPAQWRNFEIWFNDNYSNNKLYGWTLFNMIKHIRFSDDFQYLKKKYDESLEGDKLAEGKNEFTEAYDRMRLFIGRHKIMPPPRTIGDAVRVCEDI